MNWEWETVSMFNKVSGILGNIYFIIFKFYSECLTAPLIHATHPLQSLIYGGKVLKLPFGSTSYVLSTRVINKKKNKINKFK